MMDENEYEVHPLDRDYSLPAEPRLPAAVNFYPNLRRVGFITFATGFVTVLLAAVVLGNVRGSGGIETVGSAIHRFAMIIILIGGILIILAYRLPYLKERSRAPRTRKSERNDFWLLIRWNILAFFAIVLVAYSCRRMPPSALFFLANGAVTITCALMVTIAIWHRGLMRAYAVGVLVALLMNNYMSFIALTGGYWLGNDSPLLLAALVTIQISGLTCAGYVCWMKPASPRKSSSVKSRPT